MIATQIMKGGAFLGSKRAALVLLFLLVSGFYLRISNVGYLGFGGDEDITSIAVKGILEYGYPLFPTGMIYLRSLPFLYLSALSVKVFGFSEFALRLPTVAFSTGLIALGYLFVARLFNKRLALLVAFGLAVSPWEVEMGRLARMYAPFAFFYLLTLFSFVRAYIDGERRWRFVTALLAIVTCMLHSLGFTLALIFLFPLLLQSHRKRNPVPLILSFILVSVSFLGWWELVLEGMLIPVTMHQGPSMAGSPLPSSLGPFQLPRLDLLASLYHQALPGFTVLTIMSLAAVGVFLSRIVRHDRTLESLIFILITLSIYFHQFGLVAILLALFAFQTKEGLNAFRKRRIRNLGLLAGLAFSLWLLYGLTAWEGNAHVLANTSSQFRQTIKLLLDYPRLFIRAFFNEMPIMTILALLGSLCCFHNASKEMGRPGPLDNIRNFFILYAFTVPLLTHGIMRSGFSLRYNFQLHTIFILLAALGLYKWVEASNAILSGKAAGLITPSASLIARPTVIALTGLLVLGVLMTDLSPLKAWQLTKRGYHLENSEKSLFGISGLDYYPDHKTTAEYVKKHLEEDDIVIAMDWLEQYNYIGKTDYWIRTTDYLHQSYLENGQLRDIYTGAAVIPNLHNLMYILHRNQHRSIWIITSSLEVRLKEKVTEDILEFLDTLSDYVVYVGRDRESKVYLLDEDLYSRGKMAVGLYRFER